MRAHPPFYTGVATRISIEDKRNQPDTDFTWILESDRIPILILLVLSETLKYQFTGFHPTLMIFKNSNSTVYQPNNHPLANYLLEISSRQQ